MLEPWIIEQIRRREEEERRRNELPRLEVPLHDRDRRDRPQDQQDRRQDDGDADRDDDEDAPQRGVMIIDFG